MFGRLLGWYTMLPGAKFAFRPKSCVLLFWQRYCTTLEQTLRHGTRNGIMELSLLIIVIIIIVFAQ